MQRVTGMQERKDRQTRMEDMKDPAEDIRGITGWMRIPEQHHRYPLHP